MFWGLLPASIQTVLLILIISGHQYAKIGIKIWTITFLVAASGLEFLGKMLQDLENNFSDPDLRFYITTGFTLIIGLLLTEFTNKTVEILEKERSTQKVDFPPKPGVNLA